LAVAVVAASVLWPSAASATPVAIDVNVVPVAGSQTGAQRVMVGAVIGQQPATVELDSGSAGLFVNSSYTRGLPVVPNVCPSSGCSQSYSGGTKLMYQVVEAPVTIQGGSGSVTTSGAIQIGSITSATCPSSTSPQVCEQELFGNASGIMGVALDQAVQVPTLQSPLVQLGKGTPLSDGYGLSLSGTGGQLIVGGPPATASSTIAIPLIPDGSNTYPNGLQAYVKGVDLCWANAGSQRACGTPTGQNLTVFDSGAPHPFIVPMDDNYDNVGTLGSPLTQISITAPSPPQPVWSFVVQPGQAQYAAAYTTSTTTGVNTGFNTGIGVFFANSIFWYVAGGQLLITPVPPPAASCSAAFDADFNAGFNPGFDVGFRTASAAAYGADGAFQQGFNAGWRAGRRMRVHGPREVLAAAARAAQALDGATSCADMFNEAFDAGFDAGFNGGFRAEFAAAYGAHGAFRQGFNTGWRARRSRHIAPRAH
jgi:hypothetical protein